MKLLNVDSLSVSYSHIPTVKDISFSISPGEIVGLVGESGCGKITAYADDVNGGKLSN